MEWKQPIKTFCFIIGCLHAGLCSAQTTVSPTALPAQQWTDLQRKSQVFSFFEREDIVGSPYLSASWMRGIAVMSDQRGIPVINSPVLFNFDKVKNSLYTVNQSNKIASYPIDSISSFELTDDNSNFSFMKIPWISENFFLIPVTRSDKGYSLYKRLLTRLIQADFSSEGYYTKGKRYDEYVDYYEYYLVFPENTTFKKLFLKENAIRRIFKEDAVLLAEFFSLHDRDMNEQTLLAIVQFINDRKYPD